VTELVPQRAVKAPIAGLLSLSLAREVGQSGQKARGAVVQRLVLGGSRVRGHGEVHSPRANLAMMLRCTSLEPP
jgi:hypothetical protein